MNQNTFEINDLVIYMKERFDVEVNPQQVGMEAVQLYHVEIDELLIPKDTLEQLPNPSMYYTYIYENDKEWMIAVAVEAITNRPLFLVCTQDGEVVDKHLFTKD